MLLGHRTHGRVRRRSATFAALAAITAGLTLAPQAHALVDVGPVDAATGLPSWYEDENGVSLGLCTSAVHCSAPAANRIYWQAKARVPNAAGRTDYDVALFGTGVPGAANTFAHVRVRAQGLTPNATYTINHPYGTLTLAADNVGKIDSTTIFGCAAAPCDFHQVVADSPIKPFLVWDPTVGPAAPAGFVGDPAVFHAVVGSPIGRNSFDINGPNAGGAGINSGVTNQFTIEGQLAVGPFRVPDAPAAFNGVAGPTTGTITLHWDRPALDGGTAITGYNVYAGTDPAALSLLGSVDAATFSFVNSGLPDHITMHYAMTAVNAAGESVRTADLAIDTSAVPTAPRALAAAAGPGGGEITLTWQPPVSTGTSPLSAYRVYAGPDVDQLTAVADVDAGATTFVHRGLPDATTVHYRVTAVNGIGESVASNAVSATTLSRPGIIPSLSAQPGALPLSVTLTWLAPQSDGGSPITEYHIYRNSLLGSGLLTTVPAGTTTFTDPLLLPLLPYHYEVAAVNVVGEGPRVFACTHASPWIPTFDVLFPCPPA
jgi:hypothetical protein